MIEFIQQHIAEILGVVSIILGFIYGFIKARLKPIAQKAKEGVDLFREFKRKDSEDGITLSKSEQRQLIEALGDIILEILRAVRFGGVLGRIKRFILKLAS